jgi:hypothetical protein
VATLPPETAASIALIKNQCLATINLASLSEWKLFIQFGETTDSLVALSELKTVALEATDAFTRLSNLQLKVAASQPEMSSDLARSIAESKRRIEMRIPAWQQSIAEILSN